MDADRFSESQNKLWQLAQLGLAQMRANNDDPLINSQIQGSFGPSAPPQNYLAQAAAQNAPVGPAPDANGMTMGSIRNEETGKVTYLNPTPPQMRPQGDQGYSDRPYQQNAGLPTPNTAAPPRAPPTPTIGISGEGQVTDLGSDNNPVPMPDYTRAPLDVPGVGKVAYTKDPRYGVSMTPNGPVKVILGYDAQASQVRTQAALQQQKTQADIAHTQETTRASQVNNPDLMGGGSAFSGLTGDDLLKSLDTGTASQVRALAEGKMQFPTGAAMRSPRVMQLMQLVGQYDPSFDATNYTQRAATIKDFATGGKSGQKVQAINQALHHAAGLSDAIDSLDNFNGMGTAFNAPVNFFEQHALGDTRQGVYKEKADALASELRKVYAGSSGGSLAELQHWQQTFDPNASREQQRQYLQGGMQLLEGAVNSLKENYERGMGPRADFGNLISPDAKAALEKVMGGGGKGAQPAQNAPAQGQPAQQPQQVTQAQPVPNAKAVDAVKRDPRLASEFIATFGPQVAAQYGIR